MFCSTQTVLLFAREQTPERDAVLLSDSICLCVSLRVSLHANHVHMNFILWTADLLKREVLIDSRSSIGLRMLFQSVFDMPLSFETYRGPAPKCTNRFSNKFGRQFFCRFSINGECGTFFNDKFNHLQYGAGEWSSNLFELFSILTLLHRFSVVLKPRTEMVANREMALNRDGLK